MNGLAVLNLSRAIAELAHDEQSRKGLGEPYFNHAERVALKVYGWKNKSVAYLHDVVEDTYVTPEALHGVGIPDFIIYAVNVLSRKEEETYDEFIQRIIENKAAFSIDIAKIKIADIEDNMRDIDSTDMPGLKKRYVKALASLTLALEGSDDA